MRYIIITICLLFVSALGAQNRLTVAQKTEDLNVLTQTLFQKHQNPYTWNGERHFSEKISAVKNKLDSIDDGELPFALQEILALCNDLHTGVYIVPQNRIPLTFYQFNDGVFIIGATDQYSQLVKHRFVAINGYTFGQIKTLLSASVSCDNEIGILSEVPYTMNQFELLKYYGIVSNEQVELKTVFKGDTIVTVVSVVSDSIYQKSVLRSRPDMLYLKNEESYYWHNYIKEDKVLYVKINRILNSTNELDFVAYFNKLFDQFMRVPVSKLVIDLRNNWGGDDPIYRPFIAKLLHFIESKQLNSSTKFYVITGRETVSAGQHLVNDLEYLTNATFIGEATQQNVHFFSDGRYSTLPNSKIEFRISTGWLQNYNPAPYESRHLFTPRVEIPVSGSDYFGNIDRVMKYILEKK